MRFSLIAAILLAGVATPALAQRTESVEQRVNRLEQELRAVQRRVFPGGRAQFVEPEIRPQTAVPTETAPSSTALSNLTARVDALEAQLRTLTNQVEEQGFRTRQVEQQLNQLRTDLQARLDRIEPARPATTPEPAGENPRAQTTEAPTESPAENAPPAEAAPQSAEQAYNEGYRLSGTR
jgi:TolA-binding protein